MYLRLILNVILLFLVYMFELNCPDFVWLNTQTSFSCDFKAFTNNDGLSLIFSFNGNTSNLTITSTLANYAISTITFTGLTNAISNILNVTTQITSLEFSASKQIYC